MARRSGDLSPLDFLRLILGVKLKTRGQKQSSAKIVAVALLRHANARTDWSSFPSHATLARETDLGENTIGRALEELRAMGLVSWAHVQRERGGQTANRYYLLPEGWRGLRRRQVGAGLLPSDADLDRL